MNQKIITYDYLKQFKRIHVKITDNLFDKIKNKILEKYGSLRGYNKILKIEYPTLKWEFRNNIYHPFYRLLEIIQHIDINKDEFYHNIIGFYHWGSHNKNYSKIPKEIEINEQFVEGYALYLAEGDTGFNGKTIPRKLRFTNSDINVINHFIKWLNNLSLNKEFYVNAIFPKNIESNPRNLTKQIKCNKINLTSDSYNRIVKYRICTDSAILIDLILAINERIKEICVTDKNLAKAYIRGMMIGEGTAYFNKSRYVRIEMKNEKEIKYIHKLFTLLDFECKPSLRPERENMWSIYIGAKQLGNYKDLIGFRIHEKRQKILDMAVNKKLRVNQYK